jgi:hypothetical protein
MKYMYCLLLIIVLIMVQGMILIMTEPPACCPSEVHQGWVQLRSVNRPAESHPLVVRPLEVHRKKFCKILQVFQELFKRTCVVNLLFSPISLVTLSPFCCCECSFCDVKSVAIISFTYLFTSLFQVEIRPMMYVALTYDHRLIDGREAVTFIRKIKTAVEDPRSIFLDL